MSTQFPDGNAADAPHVGAASGRDANPIAGAMIIPGKSATSFARPTAASSARSSALPRAIGSANLRQVYDADSDDDKVDITQIRRSAPSHPSSPLIHAQDSSDSFKPSPPNVTTTRGSVGFHYPALRLRSDAQRTDNSFTYQTEDGDHGTTSKPARKVTGYVIPKTDVPQGSQPTLAAYEYDANGEPMLVGELNEAFIKSSTTETREKLYQLCFDTVHTLHKDLTNLQARLTDAQEDLTDERVAKLDSQKQVKFLTKQLEEVRSNLHVANQDLHVANRDLQSKLNSAERRTERHLQRKDEYKTALNQESIAHNKTKEQLKAYASTVRPSLHGNSHDSASDESDGPAVTLQVYKKLPDQWRSRAEHLMSDDTFTKDFAKFSHKLRHLEQLHSALQPSHNPGKGNSGGGGRGGGGGNNRNRNRNADNAQPKGSGANRFIISKPYRERTVMETQVLADLERCFKCTRAGHKPNSDDAPCKDMDKLTSMGRYPEVRAALKEARKAAGVPIPKAAGVPIPKAAVRINAVRAPTPPAVASDARSENE
ncbi:hypothetical protein PTNB29_02498 [Pyrenophora teres f. teres]|nr:hypothetical protein PTNB29_02498 [Pyrenophora teres f. teres]